MSETVTTKGINPYLIILALSQKSSISLCEVDSLNVLSSQLAATIDTLAGAAVTLENLAGDMDSGEIDYYGNTDTIRKQAEILTELSRQLSALFKHPQLIVNKDKYHA